MVRTIVVAVSTLAILLVVFSMYQYSQLSVSPPPSAARPQRLPSIPTQLSDADHKPSGVSIGPATLGSSQNVTISLYPREGEKARLELTVTDWAPKEGSDHEFLLRDPEIRMRNSDGNDVKVVAREGNLEARRKGGSGLEPQRGNLSGNVVVEFDRRTDAEKEKLPEALRSAPSPGDLVRLETDELEFDVEFGRLTIPGRLTLAARDVTLEAFALEVRFDEQRNRVESLRIDRGGRLELVEQNERLRLSVPGAGRDAEQSQTIVEWLRATIQARLESKSALSSTKSSGPMESKTERVAEQDGVPVFRVEQEERTPGRSIRYFGRFEGDVDARQQVGDITQSRLQADELEILRDFSPGERQDTQQADSPSAGSTNSPSASPAAERVVLTWSGRLLVEALSSDDPRGGESGRSLVTAKGAPARLSHPDGDASCAQLSYDPEGGEVHLMGTESTPVVVRSQEQGSVTGRGIVVLRNGDSFDLVVAGPGRLMGELSANTLSGGTPATPSVSPNTVQHAGDLRQIDFTNELHATGRILHKTSLDFTGSITAREYRLLDHVTFDGRTTLREGETSLEADSLTVNFSTHESWHGIRQFIDRVVGTGNILMTQGRDRLTCQAIDVTMRPDSEGGTTPLAAVATGDVVAIQGNRTLEAKEKLIVDFERIAVNRPKDVSSASSAVATQVLRTADHANEAHLPALAVADAESTGVGSAESPSRDKSVVVARRLRAYGGVTVFDPSQPLELSSDQLDCLIGEGRQIESAVITGLEDRPANVRLDTFTVTGREINLNVADQRADVPGRGRMTFQSRKDLDGRRVASPIPIAVTWADQMSYRGRDNRAVFSGDVHATSEATTTFDCQEMLVEFEDPATRVASRPAKEKSWSIPSALSRLLGIRQERSSPASVAAFSKEPRYIEATGMAVAETAEMDPSSGKLKSRARISGPKLSVHLRSELSKLLIEGPGNLQLEDFRPARSSADAGGESAKSLETDIFSTASDAGPSKTLIQWQDRMWYDFAIDQTLFEGRVQLTHLSGMELQRVFGTMDGESSSDDPGRRTFLTCDGLSVDFLDRSTAPRRSDDQRMGRLSSDRLRQFRAFGSVVLRDEVDRLTLNADEIIYERPRKILLIRGDHQRKARIVKQSPGKLPEQVSAERLFYNLATGQIEVMHASIRSSE